jgi:hypothetical protein
MATILNFEIIFDKFRMCKLQSKLKITTSILIEHRIKKLCNKK